MTRKILFAMNCKLCGNEFVYCLKHGRDLRCYDCKNGTSVEAVQKELNSMSEEEYQEIMDEIKELD